LRVVLDPAAVAELREAAVFYDDCREGLGQEYLSNVEAAIDAIAHRPTLWRRLKGRFRRCLVHRFPYGVAYAVEDDVVYVAAVMHLKRRPGYWESRDR
jgi:plasmid stabilization system protein ParE